MWDMSDIFIVSVSLSLSLSRYLCVSEQRQHLQCGSCKGAVDAAAVCDAPLCVAELQARSGFTGQGERGLLTCWADKFI